MKALLKYLISNISGSDSFEIEESTEADRVNLLIKADTALIGMIIGKQGNNIRSIRKLMSIKATLENKLVNVSVNTD